MAEQLIPYVSGMQYNGSNGGAILAAIPAQQKIDYSITIVAEAGGVVVISYEDAGPSERTLVAGDWLIWTYSTPQKLTDEQLNAAYIKRSDLP